MGGYYFGLDWFSNQKEAYSQETEEHIVVDSNTKVFSTGYFAGLGNVHFSDEEHIRQLLTSAGFSIIELYEKTEIWRVPCYRKIARWNFVAHKVKI